MRLGRDISIAFAVVALAIMALFLIGCGEDEEVSIQCDVYAESIIPDPDGKPQHIYFFSPT